MAFIVTEPKKIEGTDLAYAVYPYEFSIADGARDRQNGEAKLNIFKLKESCFVETECILEQKTFTLSMQTANVVEKMLKSYIVAHEEHVKDSVALDAFLQTEFGQRCSEKNRA